MIQSAWVRAKHGTAHSSQEHPLCPRTRLAWKKVLPSWVTVQFTHQFTHYPGKEEGPEQPL